ncbi:wall-associated receptor kinase 2-like [Phoenix dactylifera]|uniref:Wall-associated receptor kinase 2-like n=1 Tax=Phoenix dactylifera TaxID=42345 RepID=A0A8B7BQ77_PHODC|nr:wall-associated receptor kinase 2-like [Phoenix dactylifera]
MGSHPLANLLFLLLLPASSHPTHDCPRQCGGVDIPFPFGIGPNCSLPGFQVSCDHHSRPPLPYLASTQLRILSICNGELRVDSAPFVATDCSDGRRALATISLPFDGPFTISGVSNRFVAIGCDTVAVVADGGTFTSGCVSLCSTRESVLSPGGACSGVGCCEAKVPRGRRYLSMGAANMFGYVNVSAFDNCSYSFVVERGGYEFREEDLREFPGRATIAMRLEWAVGDDGDGGCGENAYRFPAVRGSGYLCNCSEGYAGNPYPDGSGGCQDVDECKDPESNPCVSGARCYNKIPGYACKCPFGSAGDGTKHGSGCRKVFQIVEAVLGTRSACVGIVALLLCGLWFYFAFKKRALIKLKEKYFHQNGGLLLKQQLSTREGTDCTRVFSAEELKRATFDYDDARILGTGAYGTVYKGVLEDGTTVAIKKSKVMDQSRIDQFVNEVVILTQINHRNVVRLLGCCLETKVPMLVYEFISNGTLYKHIHDRGLDGPIPWRARLRIATETAEALAYLHSAASMVVFHRDVKSSNILLDDNYTAKVSDFGISRLLPLDQTQVPTLVQGTFGYLDPEYLQTNQLTAKSDVYSFGVVLVELLTGQKPVSFQRSREDINLAMYFLSSLKCKDLKDFIDGDVMREASVEQLSAVSELARKCLLLRGDKRPTMKEVAQELLTIAGIGSRGGDETGEESEDPPNKRYLDVVRPTRRSSNILVHLPQKNKPVRSSLLI